MCVVESNGNCLVEYIHSAWKLYKKPFPSVHLQKFVWFISLKRVDTVTIVGGQPMTFWLSDLNFVTDPNALLLVDTRILMIFIFVFGIPFQHKLMLRIEMIQVVHHRLCINKTKKIIDTKKEKLTDSCDICAAKLRFAIFFN